MKDSAKVVCMMVVLMSLAVIAMASESSIVTQTTPITFHAERGIFFSAEILNPWTDNQILKVVLLDSTILYRDLNTNDVWKEHVKDGKYQMNLPRFSGHIEKIEYYSIRRCVYVEEASSV